VFVRVDGDALVDVAALPADSAAAWDPATDRGLWGQVWDTGLAAQRTGSFSDPTVGHAAVIPLTVGARRVGLVGLEWGGAGWPPQHLRDAQRIFDDAALRIDTAYLFSEVRALATAEERRRLSREIHDGVAQEVAALGFLVDAARSATSDAQTRADLDRLREELTRLVTELRLSIFDLRSNAGGGMRLGEALADYARSIGSQSGWTVHLVLEEGPNRLPRGTEAELLRIAQEALTNVRKHARARTVWVSLRVLAPSAFLRIADDGTGVPDDVGGHFGLAVMRERAGRIAATLSIRPRPGGGTVVECVLGQADAPDAAAPDALAGLD
jgi:signal transduction histidine kinase